MAVQKKGRVVFTKNYRKKKGSKNRGCQESKYNVHQQMLTRISSQDLQLTITENHTFQILIFFSCNPVYVQSRNHLQIFSISKI